MLAELSEVVFADFSHVVGEQYGADRTELACARAVRLGARSYKTVANILALKRE